MPYTFKHGDRPLEGLTVQRAVGRGGFGEVYYALTDSGKQVALKYLRENPEIELRGIAQVMNLKSPHLITIYDVRQNAAGEPFVIMEYVSGPSLREMLIAEPSGFTPQKTAFLLSGICKGLAYLHERGIVHRDLKPANIFYDDGYVKIGDYGLSKHISVSRHSGQTVSVGTVHYMAPEIGSGSYTKAIDIYAVGVILYEMLTGRLPFTGSSMGEILMRHLSDRPDLSAIPEPFAAVVAKALAKDPTQRYQDADEMLAAVMDCGTFSQDVASFDVSALSAVPRAAEAVDPDRTVTTPPRPAPVPPLDVRDAHAQWQQAAGAEQPLPERLQRRLAHLSHKLEQKAVRLERKFGPRAAMPGEAGSRAGGAAPDRRQRAGQVFILLAVTAGIAVLLAFLHGGREIDRRAVCLALYMVGGTVGPLVAHLRFLQRSPTRNTFLDRLAYASLGALCMAPAALIANQEFPGSELRRLIFAPLAMLLVCDWSKRIESGRAGKVAGGHAVWPAIVGLIAAGFFDIDRYEAISAAVCAAIVLLTESAAAMWPHARRMATPPIPGAAVGPGVTGPLTPEQARPVAGAVQGVMAQRSPVGWPPGAAPGRAAARPLAALAPPFTPVPRGTFGRALFTLLTTMALIVGLGSFFSLVIAPPSDRDERAGLLFATLSGLAWLPFLLSKALQEHKLRFWRGTLRPFVISAGLNLTAGMIALISFEGPKADELTAAIFALVSGVVVALVALCVPGQKWRTRPAAGGPFQAIGPWVPAPEAQVLDGAVAAGTADQAVTSAMPSAAPAEASGRPPEAGAPGQASTGDAAPAAPPVIVEAAQPSFVGRTAHAGVVFVGKVLLLCGLALALWQGALRQRTAEAVAEETRPFGRGARTILTEGVPPQALIALAGAGSLLLVVARRKEGAAHFVRGCLGCGLLVWGVMNAMRWAEPGLNILFTSRDWNALSTPQVWKPLAAALTPLGVGLVLLLWPRAQRGNVIVV